VTLIAAAISPWERWRDCDLAFFHLSPRAGRGRESEANEGEGAHPRFSVPLFCARRRGPLTPTLSPHAGAV
jgi:hypothetical protein